LLYRHDWLRPIGLVKKLKVTANGLEFAARVANRRLAWVEEIWRAIATGRADAVSVGPDLNHTSGLEGEFHDWPLEEISVAENGANKDAVIWFVKATFRPERCDSRSH
jgi:hypothetical protein